MKVGIMVWGAFLIIGGMAEHVMVPSLMSSMNNIFDLTQGNILPGLSSEYQASPSYSMALQMNFGIEHLHSQLASVLNYVEKCSIVMGVIGVGLLAYGGVAKNPSRIDLETNEIPLNILKKRLAKGDITKMEFDNLIQYFLQ